jgi:hypothetical protein
MEQYGEALKIGPKHVYEALPRLLSMWFDFTAIEKADTSKSTQPYGVSGKWQRTLVPPLFLQNIS